MKAVILAGGRGTRISEESTMRPKPMIELGGKPILWHIMKLYSADGINDFVICLGYKGYVIKEYFANYFLHTSDVTFDVKENKMEVHEKYAEPWRVTLVDTGVATDTGGRIKRVAPYVGDEDFCVTYGDGVSDLDIPKLLQFHKKHGHAATVTAVQPQGRFGSVTVATEEGMIVGVHGKAARRRSLDQCGLLRSLAQGLRIHRGRRHGLGTRIDGRAHTRRRALRLHPRRLLVRHGHDARQGPPGRAVELREGSMEDLVVTPKENP